MSYRQQTTALLLASWLLLAAAYPIQAGAQESPHAPRVGATVANIALKDIHRRGKSLADFQDAKALVVAFVGTECPLANLALPKLVEMHAQYTGKGVQFIAINANVQDTFTEVSAHAQERQIPFPVLKDFEHEAADAFGATRTPEFFVLDAQRMIRYHGRIDDQAAVGVQRMRATRSDLKEALDELLAGKVVSVDSTEFEGCNIGRATKQRLAEQVTYAKHVSRIMQRRCQQCHRPGEIGPMSLLTYDDARDWAQTIHEVVSQQRMPPWHADPRFGEFSNDRRLTREESDTLLAWVEQDCPQGDASDLPVPQSFTDGWSIGQPDVVFQMTESFKVPATGVLDYQNFVVDPGLKEDTWVQLAEARPGNRAVVHHILVYLQAPGKPRFAADGTASMLVGWAPGDMPVRYPPGTARLIPAGSKFVFEVHYTPNGLEQTDRSSVGIVFAKEPPQRAAETNILANMGLRLPPGVAEHTEGMDYTFREDALLLSFMPHLHLRGLRAKYVATYPDGRSETLLFVPDYDFNWQSVYRFRQPLEMPKGTKLSFEATWDNSSDNPRNPDPSKEVRWGLQTWDEMQNGWMEVVWKGSGR